MRYLLVTFLVAMTFAAGGAAQAQSPQWSGPYVGLQAGYGDADIDWAFNKDGFYNAAAGDTFSSDPDGYVLGGQLGYQRQWGNVVAGVEVSFAKTDLKQRSASPFFDSDVLTTDVDKLLHVVGRLGYSWNNILVYAKGGYAGADVEIIADDTVASEIFRSKEWQNGWTAGGGFEMAFANNLSLALDYSYTELDGNTRVGQGVTAAGVPNGIDESINIDGNIHAITARLNFRLGGRHHHAESLN